MRDWHVIIEALEAVPVDLRYSSDAARKAGQSGRNVVIFRNNVRRPNSVSILGPNKKPLAKWP